MDYRIDFRNLTADDIECRVALIRENGVMLLLYKDARCDMNVLDETVGPENWQRKHYECKNNLFCSVGIKIENEWIWKDDCGAESKTEKEKGEASDSFKRACVNWGIGRELYTSPLIWIDKSFCNIGKNEKGVLVCKTHFKVKNIVIENKKIIDVVIVNDKNIVVFNSKNLIQKPQPTEKQQEEIHCPKCNKIILAEFSKKENRKVPPKEVLSTLGMCADCYRALKSGK